MDSHTNQFLQDHHDFVLKLKIKSSDGSNQIRRVRLPRLADANGNVSYDELVGLTVAFTFPEGSPQNYTVSLTYFDVDEDTVTIASTDELVDAIEQFAEKKLLRLTTEVKPRASSDPVPPSVSPFSSAPNTSTGGDAGTREEAPVNPHIKDAIDTFVGILSMAVNHLQEGLSTPSSQPRAATVTVTPVVEEDMGNVAHAAAPAPSPECEARSTTSPEKVETATETNYVKPFIHGRHTCDSCLVTPIIGKRYHAINLPDYDLCENCYVNYTGKEVKFEAAELERDRPFQARWHRRREKIERFQHKRSMMCDRAARRCVRNPHARFGKHGADPSGRHWEGCHGSYAPPCHPGRPGPPFGPRPPFASPHAHWMHGMPGPTPPNGAPSNDRTNEFDDALKEAIRRSLRDIAPKEAELFVETHQATTKDAPGEPDVFIETKSTPTEGVAEESEPLDEMKLSTTEAHCVLEDTHLSPMQEVVSGTTSDNECEPDIMVEPDNIESTLSLEETKAMEEAMETASVDSEQLLLDEDRKPAAVMFVQDPINVSTDVSKEDSFQSEAVGSGEIAEAVGATLDLVAGMISDMLYEADTPSKKSMASPDSVKCESHEDAIHCSGALIVEPATSKDVPVISSEESEWQVVGSDSEDEFVQADEDIARAAEMLGSALFQSITKGSDEHSSHGNMSTLSDSFSVPSTVVSLNVGEPQRARWSAQLMKLQELGFEDEAQSVEILERLQAANIGVESEDDVSVTQVVNAILEQQSS